MKKIYLSILIAIYSVACMGQTLLTSTFLGHRTKAQLQTQFNLPIIKNGVDIYKVTYLTPDVSGNPSTASGLMVVPEDLTKIYPLLCYQHGTSASPQDVPSALNGESGLVLVLSGMGYVAVSPDYLGLGDSPGFHPYVHAATEASVGVDLLRAARDFADDNGVFLNGQTFLTGYSQGGHAAMALHRELETELSGEFTVTAAAPMSGPYSVGDVMREKMLSEDVYMFPSYLAYTILSYQLMYGNLYTDMSEVFKSPYLEKIMEFNDGSITRQQLNDLLVPMLQTNAGAVVPIKMLQDGLLAAVLSDPNHPFNIALSDNDVYDWAPNSPTRLFYCTADDQVPFQNSVVAEDTMIANGTADIFAVDVSPTADHGGCVFPAMFNTILFFQGLQQIGTVSSTADVQRPLLEIYPNPAGDVFYIKNISDQSLVRLFDARGQMVVSTILDVNNSEIHTTGLNDGVYFIEMTNDTGRAFNKLIIRH